MKLQHIAFYRRALLIAPLCATLGGCMSSAPIWESHFGEAVRTSTQAQIIDPNAAERVPSTPGVDGKAAVSTMDLYDKSFRQPPATANAYTMGVSGSSSGGGGQ